MHTAIYRVYNHPRKTSNQQVPGGSQPGFESLRVRLFNGGLNTETAIVTAANVLDKYKTIQRAWFMAIRSAY